MNPARAEVKTKFLTVDHKIEFFSLIDELKLISEIKKLPR